MAIPSIVFLQLLLEASWNVFRTECEINSNFSPTEKRFPDIDKQTFGAEIADLPLTAPSVCNT
jgi:hypothetical protein